jgi:putative N6-adenine-specific DNA methylase/tRNA (guanine6-N2)-methyltransferase
VIIRATTTPGLEDIALAEGGRLLELSGFGPGARANQRDPFGLPGIVTWALGETTAFREFHAADPLRRARSLYHVAVHVAELEWDGRSLASLLDGVRRVDLDEMRDAESYRVSCNRVGTHEFQSPEVEREVGSVLQDRYGTRVDLEHYRLHVKVDVCDARAFVGYQLTSRKGLDRRYRWVYHPRVTLRTPIAYAMLVLAGYAAAPGPLYDPFCGSGTILLEADGLVRDGGAVPPAIAGSDRDEAAVRGASANLATAGLGIPVARLDARDLTSIVAASSLDYIVTNPPFGIRLARGANLISLYRDFLSCAATVLRPGGVLALLVARRRGAFNKVLRDFPEFSLLHVRVIEMGGVYAGVFVLRRVDDRPAVDGDTKPE